MAKQIDIRIFNKDKRDMEYYFDVKVQNNGGINRVFGYIDNNDPEKKMKWVNIGDAMQKTIYDIGNEPIYEKDVIVYKGEPCMVFIDPETYDSAIFYGNEKLFLKDVVDDAELLTNIYEDNSYAKLAVENFKTNCYKAYVKAEILVVGSAYKNEQIGALMIKTDDGLEINKRYKFMDMNTGYAELYAIMDSLIEIKIKQSKANIVTIKSNNKFIVDILNNIGIVYHWRKNNWLKKDGQPVKNSGVWGRILDAAEGLTIKAVPMNQGERDKIYAYIKE